MKLLGALFLVSLAASNLRTCEAAGKKKVHVQVHSKGRHHAYGIRRHLDQSQTQTEDMDHFNVTLENNELLHQLLSLMNSSSSSCTTASEPKPDSSSSTCTTPSEPNSYPMDCSDIFADGQCDQSGIYKIFPLRNQLNKSLEVLCDMKDGGGWTVFLLRDNASEHVDFNRNWNEYKEFFGSANQEYWIGNENLHALTSSNRSYEFRFDAKDVEGSHTWVEWNSFSVASEENGYQLTLGGYDERNTVEEYYGFGYNNGMNFSTFDRHDEHCAKICKGGWWYNSYCTTIYPTGIHGKDTPEGVWMIQWSKEDSSGRHPKWLQFKIRPTN